MKGRILVVEDNLVTAEVIKHQLGKLGYTVAQVLTTGEEAVEWVLENDADLILMDVQLDGEIDGVEAASFIRHGSGSQKGSEVPIVYLTATSDLNTISRASVTRASGYLPKPFDQHALHGTIQMALGRRNTDAVTAEDRDRLSHTFAALPEAVIAIDAAGAVTSMNNLAAELTGWKTEATVGQDIAGVLRVNDGAGHNVAEDIPALFLTADLSPVTQSVTVISARGEQRCVDQVASPIVDDTGRLIGIVLEFRPAHPRNSPEVAE